MRTAPCSGLQVKLARVTLHFSSDFEKMSTQESDVRKIIAKVEAISWRLRKCVRVRELAATHRRLRVLKEKKACKREDGFAYNDTAAEMDARRFRTNSRWTHTHDEFTLELRVHVEGLG